jgi:ribonucleoside-triphosphate reductase
VNQSSFTNFTIFDREYFEALFGDKTFPDGSYMIDFEEEFINYEKAFMKVVSKIRETNMMTFPVLTFSLLRVDGKFIDEEFARFAVQHNMRWNDSNFYISEDVTSLSNCCRLVSDINTPFFNSIGGTALEVGSIKVNTINLARIAYETNTKEEYMKLLEEKTILCLQTLDVIRHIIKRNIEKGLLPNYSCGALHLESQYNTIGIIGIYEAIQKFGFTYKDEFGNTFYTDEGLQFAKDFMQKMIDVKTEFAKDKDYMINIEQIPGERAAAVLMQKDQIFFPDEAYELPLYGNQFIPLGVKTTLQEKVRVSAVLDAACSGGSILHANVDAPIHDFDTAWRLINYIADSGVKYFALCVRISTCKNNHAYYGSRCPICGDPTETTWQRIVGFLTPEKSYSKERKAEFALRDWFKINDMGETF